MWKITHTFRHRGKAFTQVVTMPDVIVVNREHRILDHAFAAEAEYADTLGSGLEHTQIDAERL
jgi:predicted transcriptional regulator